MKNSIAFVGLLFASFNLTGCLSAQVDLEDVQITRQNLEFPGVPSDVPDCPANDLDAQSPDPVGSFYTFPTQTFTLPATTNALPPGTTASLKLAQVVVRAHGAGATLSHLHDVKLTLTSPNIANGDPQTIVEYSDIAGSEAATGELTIPVTNIELKLDPTALDSYLFSLTASAGCGSLPREAWFVDVTLKLSGTAELKY